MTELRNVNNNYKGIHASVRIIESTLLEKCLTERHIAAPFVRCMS